MSETHDMREIHDHKVTDNDRLLEIVATDHAGPGGANHVYRVICLTMNEHDDNSILWLNFQKGPVGEVGVNGITNEALIAIVLDRLRSLQGGPNSYLSTRENAIAITKLDEGLMWLHKRTRDRIARHVEGTSKP